MPKLMLGELLVGAGLVTETEVLTALRGQRASGLPLSRHPSSFLANSIEDNACPRSSSATVTLPAGKSATLPPWSGSSVTLVGHWMRFR